MSAGNQFETRRKAFLERTIEVTYPNITYTVRVGSAANDFMVDRVLNVTVIATWGSMTIVVPDGLYPGQRLLVNFIAITGVDGGQTVDVEPATSVDAETWDLGAPGDYCTLEWINDDAGWQDWNNQIT